MNTQPVKDTKNISLFIVMLKTTRNGLLNEKKIKEGMMKYNRRKNFKSSQGHGKAKINQKKDGKIIRWTKENLLPV